MGPTLLGLLESMSGALRPSRQQGLPGPRQGVLEWMGIIRPKFSGRVVTPRDVAVELDMDEKQTRRALHRLVSLGQATKLEGYSRLTFKVHTNEPT